LCTEGRWGKEGDEEASAGEGVQAFIAKKKRIKEIYLFFFSFFLFWHFSFFICVGFFIFRDIAY